jgi:hypothetical protein
MILKVVEETSFVTLFLLWYLWQVVSRAYYLSSEEQLFKLIKCKLNLSWDASVAIIKIYSFFLKYSADFLIGFDFNKNRLENIPSKCETVLKSNKMCLTFSLKFV